MTWTLFVWSACGAFGLLTSLQGLKASGNPPEPFVRTPVVLTSVKTSATTPALSRHSQGLRAKRATTPRFTFDLGKFLFEPLFPVVPTHPQTTSKGSRVS